MTKILNFALKIKGGGREGGTCEVLRPCHPPKFGTCTSNLGLKIKLSECPTGPGQVQKTQNAMSKVRPILRLFTTEHEPNFTLTTIGFIRRKLPGE